jgi:hypothetical protein
VDQAAAATGQCSLNISTFDAVPVCNQTIPDGIQPESSLASMAPAILAAAEACSVLRLCFSGVTAAVINAGQCHIAADFDLKLLTTYKENWVCVYL